MGLRGFGVNDSDVTWASPLGTEYDRAKASDTSNAEHANIIAGWSITRILLNPHWCPAETRVSPSTFFPLTDRADPKTCRLASLLGVFPGLGRAAEGAAWHQGPIFQHQLQLTQPCPGLEAWASGSRLEGTDGLFH